MTNHTFPSLRNSQGDIPDDDFTALFRDHLVGVCPSVAVFRGLDWAFKASVYVQEKSANYDYNPISTAPDDGDAVIHDLNGRVYEKADVSSGGAIGENLVLSGTFDLSAITNKATVRSDLSVAEREDGTWTPVLQGASTPGDYSLSTQVAHYSRVGSLVFLNFALKISAVNTAGSGGTLISGMPFTRTGGNFRDAGDLGTVAGVVSLPSNFGGWAVRGFTNSAFQISAVSSANGANIAVDIGTTFGVNSDLRGNFIYRTNA